MTRTQQRLALWVRDRVPHALKVHFPFRVSRYGRKMRDEVIEQGKNVNATSRLIHSLCL